MSKAFISIRSDTIARAGSRRLIDIGGVALESDPLGAVGRISCVYGDAQDGTGGCTLSIPNSSSALPFLAIRNVLYVRNSLGRRYEYRILKLSDSATGQAVVATAVPILLDLSDVLLTMAVGNTRTGTISGVKDTAGWWNDLLLPELVRHGMTYFRLNQVEVDGATPLSFTNQNGLWVLRQIGAGTSTPVSAILSDDSQWYDVNVATPAPAQRIPIVVGPGGNVIALDRDVDGTAIETVVIPSGATADGDTAPASIEGVPWLATDLSGDMLTISDPDVADAPFAIEDDQFVGDPLAPPDGISYPDKALAGSWPPLTLATTGTDALRVAEILRVGPYFYAAARNGTGNLGAVHKVDGTTGAVVATVTLAGKQPAGMAYHPTLGLLLVTNSESNGIDLLDVTTDAVVATIPCTGPGRIYYDLDRDQFVILQASGDLAFLTLGSVTTTTLTHLETIGGLTLGELAGPDETIVSPGYAFVTLSDVGIVEAVLVDAVLWGVTGADLDLIAVDLVSQTVTSTTTLVTSLGPSGYEPTSWQHLTYDAGTAALWLAGYADSVSWSLAVVNPAVPAVTGELQPDAPTDPQHRANRLLATGGRILALCDKMRFVLLKAADGTTLGRGVLAASAVASGEPTVHLTWGNLIDDEGWLVASTGAGVLHLWDTRTQSPVVLRTIVGNAIADDDSQTVQLAHGHVAPLRANFPTLIMEADGTVMIELWSPIAVRIYGLLSYPESSPYRGERNCVPRPVPEHFESAKGMSGQVLDDSNSQGDLEVRWHDPEPIAHIERTDQIEDAPSETPGSDENLSAHTITTPAGTGWTAWEYNGSSARYVLWATFGGIIAGQFHPTGLEVARSNVDIGNDLLDFWLDAYRLSLSSTLQNTVGLCFCVPDTAIGSWGNDDYLKVEVTGDTGGSACKVELLAIALGGFRTVLASTVTDTVVWASSTALRVGVRVTGSAIEVYTATAGSGAAPVTILSGTVPPGYQDAAHQRIGVHNTRQSNAEGFLVTPVHCARTVTESYVPQAATTGLLTAGEAFPGSSSPDFCNLPVSGFPAGYVLNPGDFVAVGSPLVFTVRKRAVVASDGTAIIPAMLALGSGSTGTTTGDPVTVYRRDPLVQQGLSSEWIVWNNFGNLGDEMTFDVLVPPPPRAGLRLFFAMEAYLRASAPGLGEYLSAPVHATIVGYGLTPHPDPQRPLLNDDMALTDDQTAISPDYRLDQWRDISGTLECGLGDNVLPPAAYGYGWYQLNLLGNPGVIYIRRLSVYWGTEAVPAFGYGNGASGIWATGQLALFNKSEPAIAYRVQSIEGTPALETGSTLLLTDAQRNILRAHPRVVSWQRELELDDEVIHQPTYELDNRSQSLIRQLAAQGGS